MSLQPKLPFDDINYGNFRHSLEKTTTYLRFFTIKDYFEMVCNILQSGTMRSKGNQEIIAIGTCAGLDENTAGINTQGGRWRSR